MNAGHSEAVYELKQNMMNILVECKNIMDAESIMDFFEWTKSLWRAGKHENFIFSYRNSLVGDAYMKLCTEFNKWVWPFRKKMYTWLTEAEIKVSNFQLIKSESDESNLLDLQKELIEEAKSELDTLEKSILQNVSKHFEKKEGHVNLVEKYEQDFESSARSLRREMQNTILKKLEASIKISKAKNNLDIISKTHSDNMEEAVLKLLHESRRVKGLDSMSDENLSDSFEKMWKKTVEKMPFQGVIKENISGRVITKLHENMKLKGSSVSEKLKKVKTLDEYGIQKFTVKSRHVAGRKITELFNGYKAYQPTLQDQADSVISACYKSINEKYKRKSYYCDADIEEILHIIDERLTSASLKYSDDFVFELKLHICGISKRCFQQMHDSFIEENDPRRCLQQFKDKYCADFKDLFHNQDQCKRKGIYKPLSESSS